MSNCANEMTRREFIQRGSKMAAGVAAGAAIGSGLIVDSVQGKEAKPDILNYNPSMSYRRLGKSNLMISEMSLGGHWRTRENSRYWGRFPNDKMPPDVQKNREDVVGRAIDLGVNYVDITTPAEAVTYGTVQKALGERIYIGYSDYILCMRNPNNRTKEALMREIDEGLRRLQMETMDIWRPQALMNGKHTDEEIERVVEVYHEAKEQGKVRFLGISSHTREFHIHLMEKFPDFSMFIFPYQASSKIDNEHSIFPLAKKKDVGIVTIKPFSGGSLFRKERRERGDRYDANEVASLAIRRILQNKYLTATLPGMTTIEELENNFSVRFKPRKLTKAEGELIERIGKETLANLPPDYAWLRDWEYV